MKNRPLMLIVMVVAVVFCFTACRHRAKPFFTEKISESEKVVVKIKRFEDELFQMNMNDLRNELKRLQKEYRFFLNADLNNQENINQMSDFISDPLIRELYADCKKIYPDLQTLEEQLSGMLSCYHHYFPSKRIPIVYSYVSGLAFEVPVKYNDTCLAIALDNYFGGEYRYYAQLRLPAFITKRMDEPFIVTDCIREMVIPLIPSYWPGCSLLDRMIYEGKILYCMDLLAGNTGDTVKIGYSKDQLDWCVRNEGNIWAYLVENKLLYATDFKSQNTFFGEAPFTSIFTKKSPARLGCWIGWQIARSYMMKNSSVKLGDFILTTDAQPILQESGYRPRKK